MDNETKALIAFFFCMLALAFLSAASGLYERHLKSAEAKSAMENGYEQVKDGIDILWKKTGQK